MILNTIIVEDEDLALQRLVKLLNKHNNIINIIDTASSVDEAVLKINKLKPDLIFLDIKIKGGDGFNVLEKINEIPFVVFATTFDQYALKAFEKNSIDYLLKPIESDRLEKTINKIKKIYDLSTNKSNDDIQIEKSKLITFLNYQVEKISIKTTDGYDFVKIKDILYIKAEDKYSRIYTTFGNYLSDYSLIKLENNYKNSFLRIHRNTLVNLNKITGLKKWFAGTYKVILEDKSTHEVSKRQVENVKKYFLNK